MKNIKYILIAFAITFSITNCKLESESYSDINSGIFPKTESDAEALVTSNVYGPFHANGWSSGNGIFRVDRGLLVLSDFMSDYGECSWRGWEGILYGNWDVNNNNGIPSVLWGFSNFLGKITLTMDRINHIKNLDPKKKAQLIAECHLALGWLAFNMYDFFGPVPIADLKTLQEPLKEKIIPRLTEDQMKKYIEDNLNAALPVLPIKYKDIDYGRFTKGLCYMILLKYYMHTGQWAKAEAAGRELTKPEFGYELVPKYKDIFTKANQMNNETIWAVNCLRGTMIQMWTPHLLPPDYPTSVPTNKWGGFKIPWNIIKTFEPNDDRLNSIITQYVSATDKNSDGSFVVHNYANDHESGNNGAKLFWGAVPNKYEIDPGTTGNDSEINLIVYRYADAITLLAEAIVRNGGVVTQEAVDLLNKVRVRAGLTPYGISDFTSKEDFLDKLLVERGHELFYEGCRRQDLIRYGKFVEAIRQKSQEAGFVTKVDASKELLPLPQNVIDEGKGQIKQNPGY